jgi:hypothetical protein
MSAAFALEPLGPPAPCGFPRCVLGAFHDGDHHLAPIQRPVNQPVFTCSECGSRFVIYGQIVAIERKTCGEQVCILAAARRESGIVPLGCHCLQLPHPHDLSEHRAIHFIRGPKHWPWTLRLVPEMSL